MAVGLVVFGMVLFVAGQPDLVASFMSGETLLELAFKPKRAETAYYATVAVRLVGWSTLVAGGVVACLELRRERGYLGAAAMCLWVGVCCLLLQPELVVFLGEMYVKGAVKTRNLRALVRARQVVERAYDFSILVRVAGGGLVAFGLGAMEWARRVAEHEDELMARRPVRRQPAEAARPKASPLTTEQRTRLETLSIRQAREPGDMALLDEYLAALVSFGQRDRALDLLGSRIQANAGDDAARLRLARLLVEGGREEEASVHLAALVRTGCTDPKLDLAHAGFHRRAGRAEPALAAYDRLLAAEPTHVAGLRGRRWALETLGRAEEAAETVERIAATAPAEAALTELPSLLASRRFQAARAALDRAPPSAERAYWAGRLAHDAGDSGAMEALERAVQHDPPLAEPLLSSARLLLAHAMAHKTPDGEPDWAQILRLARAAQTPPEEEDRQRAAEVWFLLGTHDAGDGRHDIAAQHLDRSFDLAASDETRRAASASYEALSAAATAAGDHQEARRFLEAAALRGAEQAKAKLTAGVVDEVDRTLARRRLRRRLVTAAIVGTLMVGLAMGGSALWNTHVEEAVAACEKSQKRCLRCNLQWDEAVTCTGDEALRPEVKIVNECMDERSCTPVRECILDAGEAVVELCGP